jgi:hypothetical protein
MPYAAVPMGLTLDYRRHVFKTRKAAQKFCDRKYLTVGGYYVVRRCKSWRRTICRPK